MITRGRARLASLVAVVAIAPTGSVLAPATPAHADGAPPGVVIAAGTVLNANGRAAAGADVTLYAWPPAETLESMAVGDSINLQPVATTATDSSGAYTLRVDSMDVLTRMADRHGIVNLEAKAVTAADVSSFSFPRQVVTVDGRQILAAPGYADLESDVEQKAALAPVAIPSDTSRLLLPPGAESARLMDKTCVTRLQREWVDGHVVGQVYNASNRVPTRVTYSDESYSEVGVGVSVSGEVGSWESSGTTGVTSSGSVTFPQVGKFRDVYLSTRFRWGDYYTYCVTVGGTVFGREHKARVRHWVGGSSLSGARTPSTPRRYCAEHRRGTNFTKDTSYAVTWSNGANTGGTIGINLSSRTGYTTKVSVSFDFRETRKLCGTRGDPGDAPSQMVVRSRSFA